jgi:hypothetical protein
VLAALARLLSWIANLSISCLERRPKRRAWRVRTVMVSGLPWVNLCLYRF